LTRLIALGVLAISLFIVNNASADTNNTVTTTTKIETPVVNVGLVPREIVLKWEKVAVCETGYNWTLRGPLYSGGLGITNHNWTSYGGGQFANNAADASIEEQIYIATKINSSSYVPDQYGCGHGW